MGSVPCDETPYASEGMHIPPAYSSLKQTTPQVLLMPCTYCGSAALTVAPWEGMPYVWCVCGWAWPLVAAAVRTISLLPESHTEDEERAHAAPEDEEGEESGSITPRTTSPSESDDTPTPETQSPTLVKKDDVPTNEQDLEAFLARANLPQLYAPLCRNNMWLPVLQSIFLGQLHNDLLDLVPHRANRQRLIDALHSTVDVRSSHKDKQGMWHRARDEGRTVYIRGVSGLTDLELREYLGQHHGHVVDMRYMFDPRNNSFMGYGFVMFERKEAVDSILRRTSYAVRQGVTLMVKCSDNIAR